MEVLSEHQRILEFKQYKPDYRTMLVRIGEVEPTLVFDNGHQEAFSQVILNLRNDFALWMASDLVPFLNSLKTPWIFINGDTDSLTRLKLSSEEWKLVARQGLNVFMHEPLFIQNEAGRWPWRPQDGRMVFQDLVWLEQFRRTAPCPFKLKVHLCETGLSEVLKSRQEFPEMEFVDFSTYLLEAGFAARQTVWPYVPIESFRKRLITLNFRYEPFRELLVAFLRGRDYHFSSFMTFYHQHDRDYMLKWLPFDPRRWPIWEVIEHGLSKMQTELPYSLEVKNPQVLNPHTMSIPDFTGLQNLRNFDAIKEYYNKAFCTLLCESRPLSPRGEISEKTVRPIQAMRPFMVMGAPKLLEGLRGLGFKTYHDLWDESYDGMDNPEDRVLAFLQQIDWLMSRSQNEMRELSRKAFAIALYNREHLLMHLDHRLKSSISPHSGAT